jgi:hypothetical protein
MIINCDCCDKEITLDDNDERKEVICEECADALFGIIEDFLDEGTQ